MEKMVIDAKCKVAEVPVIGGFVIDGALEDVTMIQEVANDIDEAFLQNVKTKQEVVEKLVQPLTVTSDLKTVTNRLQTNMNGLRPRLNILEVQLERAAPDLTFGVAEFGLSTIRKCISKKDVEGTAQAIAATMTQVDKNTDALQAKGMTAEQRDWFTTAEAALRTDNALQERIIKARGVLTAENVAVINDYWKDVSAVMKVGKLIFKDDPPRRKEYTFAVLKKRVSAAQQHTGTVNVQVIENLTSDPIANADVRCKRKGGTDMMKSVKRTGTDGMAGGIQLGVGEYDLEIVADGCLTEPGTFVVTEGVVTEVVVRMRRSA